MPSPPDESIFVSICLLIKDGSFEMFLVDFGWRKVRSLLSLNTCFGFMFLCECGFMFKICFCRFF